MSTTVTRTDRTTHTEKGISLARGPALVLGTILEVAGLYFLYKQSTFPKLSNFPNGGAPVEAKVFFGIFGVNGWTGLFTAACGGLLLFGAAQHLLAKTMSLVIGVALGAAAVIAVVSGNVLGLAAANDWTKLGWAVCAVILLFNFTIPRRRRTVAEPVAAEREAYPAPRRRMAAVPGETAAPVAADREPVAGERRLVSDREPVAGERPVVADREPAVARERAVDEPVGDDRAVGEPVAHEGAVDEPTAVDREPLAADEPGAVRRDP